MTIAHDTGRVAPSSDIDLYDDRVLLDPFPVYDALRQLGGAVWLERLGMHALTRYDDVKRALADGATFSSSSGVMMNEAMNQVLRGNTLCSDGAQHDAARSVIGRPLTPKALRPMQADLEAQAETLVRELTARGSFDAVTDLAQFLPVTVVSNLVGLPEEGRERMLDWAANIFDSFGPDNERTRSAMAVLGEVMDYATTQAVPGRLEPGGWAEAIYAAADAGLVERAQCPVMVIDYVAPSLDTTIFAISSAVHLFGENPDHWDLVRADPTLIPGAINEVLRLQSPIQGWSRMVTTDVMIDGVTIPAGGRVLLLWAAANRDPREFTDPDRFDVRRNAVGHLGFGHGPHACVGMNLAKLEIKAVLAALTRHVQRFEITHAERVVNSTLRGFRTLQVSVS